MCQSFKINAQTVMNHLALIWIGYLSYRAISIDMERRVRYSILNIKAKILQTAAHSDHRDWIHDDNK